MLPCVFFLNKSTCAWIFTFKNFDFYFNLYNQEKFWLLFFLAKLNINVQFIFHIILPLKKNSKNLKHCILYWTRVLMFKNFIPLIWQVLNRVETWPHHHTLQHSMANIIVHSLLSRSSYLCTLKIYAHFLNKQCYTKRKRFIKCLILHILCSVITFFVLLFSTRNIVNKSYINS